MLTNRILASIGVALFLLAVSAPAMAQFGSQALVAPGDSVAKGLLQERGGSVGRDLATVIGVRPVLVVYWRPGDVLSERALMGAWQAQRDGASDAVLFPVAALAARQTSKLISQRLAELGMQQLKSQMDGGQLAQVFGIRKVPSFALIDVTGVLRLVGGADVSQQAPSGTSIIEALVLASQGKAVPTLGLMSSHPVYQLLGKPLPPLTVTELDGSTWRKVTDFLEPGKKLMLFYWSPTCPHCKEALPKLRQWYQLTKSEDVVLVDVARGDTATLRRQGASIIESYPWKHLIDLDRNAGRRLMVTQTPTSYLLDGEGEVLSIQVGAEVDWGAWLGGGQAQGPGAQP